ncbi:MAG: tRNA pseudouridine(38-40) synthase TruA [Pirellulaceae bacterium]
MRFFKLTVAYDGTHFSGWQWQPDRRTVQGELETAVDRVTGGSRRLVASGRTDAGVHALGQAVTLATDSALPPDVLLRALNANTPGDLVVLDVQAARDGFNAIDDAIGKRYRYWIQDGPIPDVFMRHYAWQVRQPLDADAMHDAAQALKGTHDFKSYESSGSPRVSTVRSVRDLVVRRQTRDATSYVVIEVEADGFLYNMVRNIVGTLVEVGREKKSPAWPGEVLAARDRRVAGMTAPPQGLYLEYVRFAEKGTQLFSASVNSALQKP